MPPKFPVRALPASPPLVSLLTSAEAIAENEPRWEAGISYEPEVCGTSGTGALPGCDATDITLTPGSTTISLEPIVVWAGDSCSSIGFASRDWQGRARRKLLACESHLVEQELWTGAIARDQGWDNPYLTNSTSTEVTDGPLDPIPALACLEQSLAACNCGGAGMIHATPQVVTYWMAANLAVRDGRKIFSHLGTIIVPGSGYDGSAPASSPGGAPTTPASGSSWAYATSMVHYRIGPVDILPGDLAQALDRSSNTISYWAQRLIAIGFDCCHLAAEVAVEPCASGS